MKNPSRPLARFVPLLAVIGAVLLAGPALAQDCVDYQGIDHCPVGDATLQATSSGLAVSNNGGHGGVSSRFAPTVHWAGQMEFPSGTAYGSTLSSISGGETTSRLLIEPDGNGFHARATFTGASEQPTYSVLVYNDGVLQAALGGFDGSETTKAGHALSRRSHTKPGGDDELSEVRMVLYVDGIRWGYIDVPWYFHFFISPMGGCNWGIGLGEAVAMQMPDGSQVVGDEIRFSEDVSGPGHYPYLGFESIATTSSAPGFVITDELAEGTN